MSPPLLLVDLHWLPVERRIEYNIATIYYNVITGTAPPYLSDLLEPVSYTHLTLPTSDGV